MWILLLAFLSAADACCVGNMGTLYDRGSFRCPVYTDNMNCTWRLESSRPNNFLRFNFHAYDINTKESADYLRIFAGPLISYPQLGNYFGGPIHNEDPIILTESNVMLIQFRSDGSNSGGGWAFEFRIDQCLQTAEFNNPTNLLSDGSSTIGRYKNTSCTYNIKPKVAVDQITFYFESLHLSDSNDTVTIRENGQQIAVIGGSGNRKPIVAGSSAEVFFQSKKDTSKLSNIPNGFNLRYAAGFCLPYVEIDVDQIQISDGSGNKNYKDSTYCEWLFTPKTQKQITFFPTILRTAERADILTVYDGHSSKALKIAEYFGNQQMDPVYSSSNALFVTWRTDGSKNDFGWSASVITGGCLPWVNFTSQSGGFTDGSGGSVQQATCVWSIQPLKANSMITLYFRNLNLSSGSIEVYDGPTLTSPLLAKLDQQARFFNDSVAPVASSGNSVTFVMRNANGGSGFDVDFSAGRCLTLVTLYDTIGEFSDGSGDANYADSTRCGWLLRPLQNTTRVEISFDGNTAEGADSIRVYDGPTDKFPLLRTLSGAFGPVSITSNQGIVFVSWQTDGSKNSQGWRAKYQGIN